VTRAEKLANARADAAKLGIGKYTLCKVAADGKTAKMGNKPDTPSHATHPYWCCNEKGKPGHLTTDHRAVQNSQAGSAYPAA
jgi:hypothetical protein